MEQFLRIAKVEILYCLHKLRQSEMVGTINIARAKRYGGDSAGSWFSCDNHDVGKSTLAVPD